MKKILPLLLLAFTALFTAAEESGPRGLLRLESSTECGIFRNKYGEWSTLPGKVMLSYTKEALIAEAELRAAPGKTIRAAGRKDDDLSIFGGETFEFQIAPAGQTGVYYHFIYSPSGFLYSARKRDTSWEAEGLIRESRLTGDCWKFRLAVPFKAMNTTCPEKGEIWRINLARNAENGGQPEYTSLSGAADYHNLQEYTRVLFGAAPIHPVVLRSITGDSGKNILEFAGRLPETMTLEYESDTLSVPKQITGLRNSGGKVLVPLTLREGALPMKAGSSLRLILKNQADGSVLYDGKGILPADSSADLMLDRYYYTPADREIRFSCSLAPRLNLSLSRDGKVLLRREQQSGKGRISFSDFGGQHPAGRYVLTLGTASQKISRIFYLLPAAPSPAPFPEQQPLAITAVPAAGFTSAFPLLRSQLRHGGRPYYLFCFSPSYPRNTWFQFQNCSNFSYYDFGNIRKNSPRLADPPSGRVIYKPATARVFPPIDQYMKQLADYARKQTSPSVIHRISYEAQIQLAEKQADGSWKFQETDQLMMQAYRMLKETNPEMLCSIQTDKPAKIRALSRACDIFEVSFYTSSYAGNMFTHLLRDMEQVRREVPPEKPVIFWLGGTIPNGSCRTAEEIRYGVYLSILNGFAGNFIHMGHGFLPESQSRLWSLLSGLHAEVESFYPAFASGKDITGLLGKFHKAFLCRGIQTADGKILLLAVNTRPTGRRLQLPEAKTARDFLTGAAVTKKDGRFSTRFTAYEPRIFILER